MKKRRILGTLSIILLTIITILAYLWIYIFPSVEKLNRLKRDIKEYSRLIKNSENETVIFAGSDKTEGILFNQVDSEFKKRLDRPEGAASVLEDHLRKSTLLSGVHTDNIMISQKNPENSDLAEYGFGGVQLTAGDAVLKTGLRSGGVFVENLSSPDHYIVLKELEASKSGSLFIFKIHAELVTLKKGGLTTGTGTLIDMDSPLLKRRVYLTSMKLKKNINTESGDIK